METSSPPHQPAGRLLLVPSHPAQVNNVYPRSSLQCIICVCLLLLHLYMSTTTYAFNIINVIFALHHEPLVVVHIHL
jgi:hypothetical protein